MPAKGSWTEEERRFVIKLRNEEWTAKQVQKIINMPTSTQNRFLREYNKTNVWPTVIHVDRSGFNNGNAKINKEYVSKLKRMARRKNDLTVKEFAEKLKDQTGIQMTVGGLAKFMKKAGITRKQKTTLYHDRTLPQNIHRKKLFLPLFHTDIDFPHCCATDEAGIKADHNRKYGYSLIQKVRSKNNKNRRKISGGSYRDNRSRVYGFKPKHSPFSLHLIATIALDHRKPVVHYWLSKIYTNSVRFSSFVKERKLPDWITHDIIDRASIHNTKKVLKALGLPTTEEVYKSVEVERLFIPSGYPEFNPSEQLFGYIKSRLNQVAPNYNLKNGWKLDDLQREIINAIKSVTYEHVLGWYRHSWSAMFPKKAYPPEMS